MVIIMLNGYAYDSGYEYAYEDDEDYEYAYEYEYDHCFITTICMLLFVLKLTIV